jgi:hypothetical protein
MSKNIVENEGPQISNTYCFSTVTIIRERASVLRYMYIASLVYVFVCCLLYDSFCDFRTLLGLMMAQL